MDNKNPKWLPIVTRRLTVFRNFITAQGSRDEVKRYLGHGCDYLAITKDDLCSVYLAAADTKRVSEIVLEKIKQNPEFPSEHADDCRRTCESLVAVSHECATDVTGQTESVLKDTFLRYCAEYIRFAKFMAIPVAIERTLTTRITTAIQERVGAERTQDVLKKIMTPPAFSEFQKEPQDLLRLAIDGVNHRKLLIHAEKYRWLSCYNIDEDPYTDKYFIERLDQLIKNDNKNLKQQLMDLENQLVHDQQNFEVAMAELDLAESMQKEIELLRKYVYLRTYRVEMQSKSSFYIQPLFKKIAHHLNLSLRLALALTPEEIEAALMNQKTIPQKAELEGRFLSRVLRYDEGGITFVGGEAARALEKEELGDLTFGSSSELKGTSAYQGSVSGIVRVVLSKEEIKNFKDGEILVTTMTTPEFVPAMKKAAAIVTDEGGVLCHAAIMARELKVPCVIATERATTVFKTGDTIMVDATNGIVKKV